jgi:predicted nucleic acid-binding Zn ribbon protein
MSLRKTFEGGRWLRSSRKKEAVSLGDALSEWLKLSGHGAKMEDAQAEAAWKDVMGEAVSRKTRFIRVRDGVLVIELDSGPMKEEFLMARTRIRTLMNEHLGREAIREVVVR